MQGWPGHNNFPTIANLHAHLDFDAPVETDSSLDSKVSSCPPFIRVRI